MVNRSFAPHEGELPLLNGRNSRKCLYNKTIAFVGDSQMRDLGFALSEVLNENEQFWKEIDVNFKKKDLYRQYETKNTSSSKYNIIEFPNEIPYYFVKKG